MKKDIIDKSREAKKKTFEKPILFSGKMVKAILENKKFVTRRPVDPQPPDFIDYFRYVETCNYFGAYMQPGEPCAYPSITAKYWPGLRLWIRETWGITGYSNESGHEISVKYRADNSEKYNIDLDNEELFERLIDGEEKWHKKTFKYCNLPDPQNCPHVFCPGCENHNIQKPILWRPSIFIPRPVSRITLDVVTVTIERLHELDDIDAAMEGCQNREEFIQVWDALNKKRGFPWADNPWVYRIQFKKHGT